MPGEFMHATQWCHAPYVVVSENEVSSQLCLTCYTAKWIKICTKSTSLAKIATMKDSNSAFAPVKGTPLYCVHKLLSEKRRSHYASLSAKISRSHHVVPPNQHFPLSTKMSRTQKMTMKNVLYVLRYNKMHHSGWSDVEQ